MVDMVQWALNWEGSALQGFDFSLRHKWTLDTVDAAVALVREADRSPEKKNTRLLEGFLYVPFQAEAVAAVETNLRILWGNSLAAFEGRLGQMFMLSVPVALVNHSCIDVNVMSLEVGARPLPGWLPPLRPIIGLFALRDLRPGEQLFTAYDSGVSTGRLRHKDRLAMYVIIFYANLKKKPA